MKASTVRALRLPMLILLASGLLAAAVFIIFGRMSGQDHPSGGQTMFHLESAIGQDLVNTSRQHFAVDDLFVAGDKLDLRYHAIGVAPMLPGQPPPPQCWNQPPAVANVASDGNVYVPYDGSTGGQEGNPIIHGEFIWRFRGTPPHHLAISVVQLNCDTNASWTIHVDN